ncbi:plasmid pRiA4b ORF-3 family protein [Phenylobacterium sp.]|jgi:hypothetical protein|uniref:plasmid pRiA4b ORF-3 family protein n=1 Tax=Phenylobacterium sp. TaxID=1871053 RepID=UPI002F3EC0D3
MTASIARLKITLDDVAPKVLRRVEVPVLLRLDRLHLVIQAAMGWTDSHLYEIRARDVGWGEPDPDERYDGPLEARKAKLLDLIEDMGLKSFRYLYDFGDGWEHTVKIERLGDPAPEAVYPMLLHAEGRCPPEDSGGPWGYAELLKAVADPEHERHAELSEWIGEDFDPNAIDVEALTLSVEHLAKQWSRKPAVRRKA